MLYLIADLAVEVPEAGGMPPRCKEYLLRNENFTKPDIVIDERQYNTERYPDIAPFDIICYIESGRQFYRDILRYDGMMLHASAVECEGKAYLFSGTSGIGKSTHTRLWQQVFGPAARVFNDDKPALRLIDDTWYAYGTPWCGKDGINLNMKVPVAGICFLKQAKENTIRRLSAQEAVIKVLTQTRRRFVTEENMRYMFRNIEALLEKIPMYELENNATPESAQLSFNAMSQPHEEADY